MEGQPRRGRRRRPPQDQPPGQAQPAGFSPEQPQPVPDEVASPEPREEPAFTPQPSAVEEAVSPAPVAAEQGPAEQHLQPPALATPPQVGAPAQQPPPSPQKRPDRPPQPHGKPEHPKGPRDHGRGDQGRTDQSRVEQGRGDQNRGEQRRAQEAVLAALSALSPPIRVDGEGRRIEDLLRGVRKALEDECMIGQEDASERVLLDLALNAIRDRVTIHRIQPVTRDLEETERLLRLRHQSDRHVVEMLTALKSA